MSLYRGQTETSSFCLRKRGEQTHPEGQTVAETPSSCPAPQVCPLLWPGEQTLEMARAQANQVSWDLRECKVHVQIRVIRDINRHFHWLTPLTCSGQLSCQPCSAVLSMAVHFFDTESQKIYYDWSKRVKLNPRGAHPEMFELLWLSFFLRRKADILKCFNCFVHKVKVNGVQIFQAPIIS